jgi:hypothetical protein
VTARRPTLALLAALASFGLQPGCTPRPTIVSPAHGSAAPASGAVAIQLDFGSAPDPARTKVTLLTGIDGGPARIVDVTARLVFAGAGASGVLTAADLVPGRSTLFASLDADGDGGADASASASFSWEPQIDAATADRCDFLDPSHCLLPFPNDHFSVADPTMDSGRRVAFQRASMPANGGGVHVDPTEWNRNDGASPGAKILTVVPGVDLATTGAAPITDQERSLDPGAPIVLLDATTGQRHPFFAELDANTDVAAKQALIVRPTVNLPEGHRFVVALRRLVDASGAPIAPGRAFRIYRDRVPTYVPEIEARRAHMESIFDALAGAGIARDDLFLAWDFTVASERNLSERMLHIRDDAFASLQGGVPAFQVTAVENLTPAQDARIARRVTGEFQVPLYLTGGGATGTRFRDANDQPLVAPHALPVRGGSFTARFLCNVSRTTLRDDGSVVPARAGIYGHGLLGDPDEINAGNVKDMSVEHGFVFCATPWIGMAEEDVPTALAIVQELSLFPVLADRTQQGMLNALFLARLMKDARGFATDPAFQGGSPAQPVFTPGEVFYDGNSQGGIIGGAVTAVSTEWTRAVLGVPGMNYSTLLRRSQDFAPFAFIMNLHYTDELEQTIALALIQMLWDRAEANGYALHMTDDPLPGTPAHQVLMHVAFGDHQVADVAAEIEARTIGARIHQPALSPGRHTSVNPYWGIPALPAAPWAGSAVVIWDSGNPPAPLTNTPPTAGNDPHERPRRQPAARLQKSEFLRTGGAVIDVCGGAPCLAP